MTIVVKTYRCPECGDIERSEEHTSIARKCWQCGSKQIERIITPPIISRDAAPRTVGSLLEKNNKKNPLTREKQFGKITERKLDKESKLRKIAKMTPEQKQKYIEGKIDV